MKKLKLCYVLDNAYRLEVSVEAMSMPILFNILIQNPRFSMKREKERERVCVCVRACVCMCVRACVNKL